MAALADASSSSSSNHSDHAMTDATTGSNPPRKVRVVAKIRGFGDREAEFAREVSWISVNKPNGEASESVTVSFGDQSASRKDSYEVDYCYDKNEGNELIFSREVKPLISGVFEGCNATVIAYGARSTGKSSVIQGSCEKPGLAALAMAEILSAAEDNGNSVAMSFYEVYQDRIFDLLDPKQQAVFVLEDKQGKIQLKGLSQVPVSSISDFQKLYVGFGSSKPAQKIAIEPPRKGHRGLIVHISSSDNNLHTRKINFVDLAGYEDVRRKSTDGLNLSEQSKINTSVYAFLNVIHALSAKESRVPYRESKLARILQDSLGGPNKVLLITCLNSTFCQDSIYMIKLASRSCQKTNRVVLDSTKKLQSWTKPKMVSSNKSQMPKTVSATAKKQATSRFRVPLSEKKVNGVAVPFAMKGRKLFDEKSKSTPLDKVESSVADNISVIDHLDEEAKPIGDEILLPDIPKCTEPTCMVEKDLSSDSDSKDTLLTSTVVKDVPQLGVDHPEEVTPSVDVNIDTKSLSLVEEGEDIRKEINDSPPISARLRELSNNLKALYYATPSHVKTEERNDVSSDVLSPINMLEPKTPVAVHSTMEGTNSTLRTLNSPWETLSVRSTGMKTSLVQEYLKFLNTADKEELKRLRGIGEKRATWILELREESPEPFKSVDDLKNIGLAGKQVKDLMKMDIGGLFN